MKFCLLLLLLALTAAAQQKDPSASEDADLNAALAEAGSSQVDFIRALENHLAKYPD